MSAASDNNATGGAAPQPDGVAPSPLPLQPVMLNIVAPWSKVAVERPLADTGRYRNPAIFSCSGHDVTITAYRDGCIIVRTSATNAPDVGFISEALDLGALGLTYEELLKALKRKGDVVARRGKLRKDENGRCALVVGVYNRRSHAFVRVVTILPLKPATAIEAMCASSICARALLERSRSPGPTPSGPGSSIPEALMLAMLSGALKK